MSEHFETPTPVDSPAEAAEVIDLTDSAASPSFAANPMAVEMPVAPQSIETETASSPVAVAVAPQTEPAEADPVHEVDGEPQTFVPNPMAVDEPEIIDLTDDSVESVGPAEPMDSTDSTSALQQAPIDAFDADHHKGILDRLEHELALVDAALSHIDEDEMDAAETAIKELARHNDDGQVALPLR